MTKQEEELGSLKQIFNILKTKYFVRSRGWTCSGAVADVVLAIYAAIKELEQ